MKQVKPGLCDSHFHVFGPESRYPYAADLRYKPPQAPLADYLAHARPLGFERFVFVQPSAYGRDNACMLDAMREVGPGVCRGIVDIDDDAPDSELAKLNAAGVRGVRINVNPIKPPEHGFASGLLSRIRTLDGKCNELGWMLDFLTPGWLTRELIPTMRHLKSPFSISHMGMFRAGQEGFAEFVSLMRDSNAWPKLTGLYRISTAAGYSDLASSMGAVVEAAPDRAIWGSDYPHLSFADRTSTEELFGFFKECIADEAQRSRILIDNPARCFGFA